MNHPGALSSPQKPITALQRNLPSRTDQLLTLYQTSSDHHQRICAMAKIKNQIISALAELVYTPPSNETSQAVQLLFYQALLRFVKRWRGRTEEQVVEGRMFSHVAGLAIKYYFREEAFRCLIAQLTELLDGHSQRIQPVLSLFAQIIVAVEQSPREASTHRLRCLFQRHFTGQHLNTMLVLANFCIQKGLVRDGHAIQQLIADDAFQIRAPEDTLLAAFRLLRNILCFDWLGEKFNDFEQISQGSSIVIPTKGTKQSALTQFQKWLKNCEWVRLYELLILRCKSVGLKLQVVELVGDMSRIHMKFFKNKQNFKMHVQNITYSFCTIISELELNRDSQESISLGIALGLNLNKLTSTGVGSILFQINTNFFRGLLDNIKKFIVQQIIGQQIFNSNLLLYFFKFLQNLLIKSRFQKTMARFQQLQQRIRDICRNYEHYIRLLFNRIIKNPHRKSEPSYYRLDCSRLKESIRIYETKELQIYFLPFRMMKPRYASTNCVQELFVYITARIMRALGLLQYFKLVEWERELSYQIIVQSLQKIAEWFSFTSYRKLYQERQRQSSTSKEQSDLPIIREMYEEEIENQEEYCHFLRLISFLVIEEFVEQKPIFFCTIAGALIKMVGLTLQLCFGADLQQKQNNQIRDQSTRLRILLELQLCEQLCLKVLVKQYESILFQLASNNHSQTQKQFCNYQYVYSSGQLQKYVSNCSAQKTHLLQVVLQYYSDVSERLDKKVLVKLQFLLYCSVLEEQAEKMINFNFTLKEYCVISQYLAVTPILLALSKSGYRKMILFLEHLLCFLGQNAHKPEEFVYYLRCLRHIGSMNIDNLAEEALNKLFVSLKCALPFLADSATIAEQLLQQLQIITQKILLVNHEKDFVLLAQEVNQILTKNRAQQQTRQIQSTCLSISIPETHSPFEIQHNPPNQQQIQISAIKARSASAKIHLASERKRSSLKEIQQQNSQSSQIQSQIQLYSGYHRLKTMEVLDRYVETEPYIPNNHQNSEVRNEQYQDTSGKQQATASSAQQDHIQQGIQKFIPMQIQQKKMEIDMTGCLKEILKNEHQNQHHMQHLDRAKEQVVEDLIPFANQEEQDKISDPLVDFKEIQYANAQEISEATSKNVQEIQIPAKDHNQADFSHQNQSVAQQTTISTSDLGNQEPEHLDIPFQGLGQIENQAQSHHSVEVNEQKNQQNQQVQGQQRQQIYENQQAKVVYQKQPQSAQKQQPQQDRKKEREIIEQTGDAEFNPMNKQNEHQNSNKKPRTPKPSHLQSASKAKKLLLSSYSSSQSENRKENPQELISPNYPAERVD